MKHRIFRLKNIFFKDGFKGLLNYLFYKLNIPINFKNDLSRKIEYFSKYISRELNNTIITGPFKGTKLIHNVNNNVLGIKLLNYYEKEVVSTIATCKIKKKIFINIGSSDGFYVCGLLKNNYFEKAVIFESDLKSINFLKKNLLANNIGEDKVIIFGEAKNNFTDLLLKNNIDILDSFFLIDIEGEEYKIFNDYNLNKLKNVPMIIETHNFLKINVDIKKEFNNFFLNNSNSRIINTLERKFEYFSFLEPLIINEMDKNLLTSEQRPFGQYWIAYNVI
jgi:hypothetical protein